MFGGKRPDITPAQVSAVLVWAVANAVAFGYIDAERSKVILSVGATVIAAAWKISDAVLRSGRNRGPTVPPPSA